VCGTWDERLGWAVLVSELDDDETHKEFVTSLAKERYGDDWRNRLRVAKHRLLTLLREAFAA